MQNFPPLPQADCIWIMGSQSDWPIVSAGYDLMQNMGIATAASIVSAHRTPEWLAYFGKHASAHYQIIIAAAGGAAHLPGMVAAFTHLPVIGIPIYHGSPLQGMDALLSIAQMPAGVPVGTMAVNGAKNAALYAARILALHNPSIRKALQTFMQQQTEKVLENTNPITHGP